MKLNDKKDDKKKDDDKDKNSKDKVQEEDNDVKKGTKVIGNGVSSDVGALSDQIS